MFCRTVSREGRGLLPQSRFANKLDTIGPPVAGFRRVRTFLLMAAPYRACIGFPHDFLSAMGRLLGPVFFDREIAQHRGAAVIVVNETDARNERLDDVNLLKRRDDE